jgi:hypothetical protein
MSTPQLYHESRTILPTHDLANSFIFQTITLAVKLFNVSPLNVDSSLPKLVGTHARWKSYEVMG